MLGKWISGADNYVLDAKSMDLKSFNIGRFWGVFDYFGDAVIANRGFLDAVVQRGTPMYLNNRTERFSRFGKNGWNEQVECA